MSVAESPAPYPRRWYALAILSLSLVVIGMDNTILNVALPTLVTDLGATASELQWIVDSYVLVFAGLLLTMGAVGDRFGRRLSLNVGLVLFALASAASAWAGSAEMLIATRAAMGIGAALIMPATLSIITDIFPDHERGRAIAMWAAMAGLGIIAGPVIGGWLLESFWWGSVFLVNLPVVTVALLAGAVVVPESADPDATPLDPVGAVLSIAGLSAVVYGIIEAPVAGWTAPETLWAIAGGLVILAAFLAWEARTAHPMLRLDFFRNSRFSAGSAAIMLVFFALFGAIFVLTQHLQFVLGYSALEAGWRITPIATLVVSAPLSARAAERVGTKAVVTTGLLVVTAALALLAGVEVGDGYAIVGWAMAVMGVGMGLTMAPATDAIMGSLPLAKAGVGSAMNDTTRQVGGALGVAVIGSVLSSAYSSAVEPVLARLPGEATAAAGDSVGAALQIAQRAGGTEGQALADAARKAFVSGLGDAMWVAAGVALTGAVITVLALPARARARQPEAVPAPPGVATAQEAPANRDDPRPDLQPASSAQPPIKEPAFTPFVVSGMTTASTGEPIIKTATIHLRVPPGRFDHAVIRAITAVTTVDGHLTELQTVRHPDGHHTGVVVQRVPLGHLEQLLVAADDFGDVTYRHLDSDGLSEDDVDLEARLKILTTHRQVTLRQLSHAGPGEDITTLRGQVDELQRQIDVLTSRLDRLSRLTASASVRMEFEEATSDDGRHSHDRQPVVAGQGAALG